MSRQKDTKTNAMRILEKKNILFTRLAYECEEFTDGAQVADKLNLPHERVYKTLVTSAGNNEYFVFVIPIDKELDLKKAAKAVSRKSLSMLHVKDIQAVTGYVRGGCTAVGMKKQYATIISEEAAALDRMFVSGGRIGLQIELKPQDLCAVTGAEFRDVTIVNSHLK